jgi:hypothetical protein
MSPNQQSRPQGPEPLADNRADLESSGRPKPMDHLLRALERTGRPVSRTVHPRFDGLRVGRERDQYTLSIKGSDSPNLLTSDAIRQFAALLDVPMKLLRRLAALAGEDDLRVLNRLLWAEGARKDARYRVSLTGREITAVHSATFTPLDHLGLAKRLAGLERSGLVTLRRYELRGAGIRLEIGYPSLPPVKVAGQKPEEWDPGVVLSSREDGAHSATVFPALFRRYGGNPLPLLPTRNSVTKIRHAQDSPKALQDAVVDAILSLRASKFDALAVRLTGLRRRFVPEGGLTSHTQGMGLETPSMDIIGDIVARAGNGRCSEYRVVGACVAAAAGMHDLERRLAFELSLGRYVWAHGPAR